MIGKGKKMHDRFDLEQAILAAWTTKEDLDLFLEQYMDGPRSMTEDEVANYMLGLSAIHDARMQRVFAIFEYLIAQRKIV